MFLNIFFKKRIIRKYKEKLSKIKYENKRNFLNLKKEFSKILNHDIKNALLAQNSCLELFLKGTFGKVITLQKDIISELLTSNKFLIEIIENAIFLTEIEEKTSNLNLEKVDIINQAKLCLNDIQNLVNHKKQKIILDFKNNKINLEADKYLIQKIILNLLTSSVSYGFEKSDIVVSIEENEKTISFSAKNKSIYMTKEKIKSLFDDNKTYSDFNQLGAKLNLNIAKKLVNAHNWDFILTSNENNTSTLGFVVKK